MKSSLEGLEGRFEQVEERISELEDRTMEITECEEENNIEGKKWSLSDHTYALWGSRRRGERERDRVLEEVMAENFPSLISNMNINIQET